MQGQTDAVVGNASLRIVVGADTLAAVAGAYLALAVLGSSGTLLLLRLLQNTRTQYAHTFFAVLQLRFFILALCHDACRNMGNTYSGFGFVYVLAAGTACTISDEVYGVYAGGTMAHSWVQMFDSELDAFRAYCQTYPDNATLLVDTYNSLQSGVPNAIRAFNEVLRPKGITHCGIRFDSGDIAYLTKKARKMLDDAGWPDCKITVSNALDERLIAGLLRQGAQIDSFGVGERLITARSEPVFGGVYKLAAIEDENGNIIPKIKISENVGKITNPHFKKVYRFYSKDSGMAEADYICLHDEVVDDTQPLEICDPDATWKKKVLTDFTARELLVPIFRGGRLVYQKPALDDIRAYCAQQLTTLWPEVLRFDYPHNYYVDLSEKLLKIKLELLNAGGKSQG